MVGVRPIPATSASLFKRARRPVDTELSISALPHPLANQPSSSARALFPGLPGLLEFCFYSRIWQRPARQIARGRFPASVRFFLVDGQIVSRDLLHFVRLGVRHRDFEVTATDGKVARFRDVYAIR